MKQNSFVKLLLVLFSLTLIISKSIRKSHKGNDNIKMPNCNSNCVVVWFVADGYSYNEKILKFKRCDTLNECKNVEQSQGYDRKIQCNNGDYLVNKKSENTLRYVLGLNTIYPFYTEWLISYDDSTQIFEIGIFYNSSSGAAWNDFRARTSQNFPLKTNQGHHYISAVKGHLQPFTNCLL